MLNAKRYCGASLTKFVLDRGEHDVALVRIVWRGGAVTNLEVKMKVNSVAKLTRGTEMRDRVLDLARDGIPDDEIAAPSPARVIAPLTAKTWSFRSQWGGSGAAPESG